MSPKSDMDFYNDDEPLDDFEARDFTDPDKLSNNTLAFIALSNEYCAAVENVLAAETSDFVDKMLRLLPRIYISALDIKADMMTGEGGYIAPALTEEQYDAVRGNISRRMGEDDTFLEVFVEDMKYSDTPVSATISESLADLFQVFYDFLETCRDAPNYHINESMAAMKESFAEYWAQTLVNVLRAFNAIKFS